MQGSEDIALEKDNSAHNNKCNSMSSGWTKNISKMSRR